MNIARVRLSRNINANPFEGASHQRFLLGSSNNKMMTLKAARNHTFLNTEYSCALLFNAYHKSIFFCFVFTVIKCRSFSVCDNSVVSATTFLSHKLCLFTFFIFASTFTSDCDTTWNRTRGLLALLGMDFDHHSYGPAYFASAQRLLPTVSSVLEIHFHFVAVRGSTRKRLAFHCMKK